MPCSLTWKSPPLAGRRSSRTVSAPDQVLAGTRAGTQRIRGWHPTLRQLARGDFRDGNVFFRREAPVFAVDFSFMTERARVEGPALTLY